MATKINIIIPSRTQEAQMAFLTRAIDAVAAQSALSTVEVEILLALDPDRSVDLERLRSTAGTVGLRAVNGRSKGQAPALNAGIRAFDADLVAFLEDDDRWREKYLATALDALAQGADFISSTQLELDENNVVVKINDFPTPSGWVMRARTLREVGEFDESYRFHLDNEWLGRLAATEALRCHLVEATAPVKVERMAVVRPHLFSYRKNGGEKAGLLRHGDPVPLVLRLVHSQSGMENIRTRQDLRAVSRTEVERLVATFGRLPW